MLVLKSYRIMVLRGIWYHQARSRSVRVAVSNVTSDCDTTVVRMVEHLDKMPKHSTKSHVRCAGL